MCALSYTSIRINDENVVAPKGIQKYKMTETFNISRAYKKLEQQKYGA